MRTVERPFPLSQLERMRREGDHRGLYYPRRERFVSDPEWRGEAAYRNHKQLRSAFRKGWDAYVAGRHFDECPYRLRRERADRYSSRPGFSKAFQRSWEAGWAWAEHLEATDDAETTLILQAFEDFGEGKRPPQLGGYA